MMEEMDESWWGCRDGDEFPSREKAVEHARFVQVGDSEEHFVEVRRISFGPWERVDADPS